MRKLAFVAAIALAVGVLAGLPSVARAVTTLNFGDAFDLGSIVPPEPASPPDEVGYVNTLIAQSLGSTTTIGTYTYTRTFASCGTCPAAVFNSKDESGGNTIDLGTGGCTYLLGKYDGPQGGDEVWNVQGLTGIQTIPLFGFSHPYGLSHWTLFGGGGQVPDGGTTVMLLGAALGALGIARRYIMS